jgi:hypothetical protein
MLYEVVLELWLVGEVVIEEFLFLLYVLYDMIQAHKSMDYPKHFYQHEPREALIFYEAINIMIFKFYMY